jgi:hypothetical protein
MKPWEKDKETFDWFVAAAKQVELNALENPEFPIPVDPEVAEFMGAIEDPSFGEEDLYPNKEYLEWLKTYREEEMEKFQAESEK